MSTIDLGGAVALVTGANRGIGAATALRLAEAGAQVMVSARHLETAQAVADDLTARGLAASAVVCDVTRYDQVAAAAEQCLALHGRIDFLINNAGTMKPIARLADSDPAAWRMTVETNLIGAYNGVRAVLSPMLAAGHGTIIALNSGAANAPMEGWSHYCAAKAAVSMLTRQIHKEYSDQGIRSLGLSPGPVAGDMQAAIRASGINPVSRLTYADYIPAEWAAHAATWLCTPQADPFLGEDFSIKTEEGRRLVGLA